MVAERSIQDRLGKDPNGWFDQPELGSFQLWIPTSGEEVPPWSYYPGRRDAWLRIFSKSEPIASGAIYSVVARVKALDSNMDSIYRNREEYYQELWENADDGAGPGMLLAKTVSDLCTQDNGAFWELAGRGSLNGPIRGPVTGIYHMDAARCWRTFSREYPVIYVSPIDGKYHRMHRTRVVTMSSNPQPDELARGIGFCPLSRALRAVQIMKAIQTYKYEKITGSRPGIGFGNGITQKMFKNAVQAAEFEDASTGTTLWKRVPFILNPDSSAKVDLDILSLSGLPDGFDAVDDTTLYVYALALAFGVDAREFWPATSSGATKADATIQHLKARGKGIGDLLGTISGAVKRQVLPADGSVKFEFDYTDSEEDKVVINNNKVVADMLLAIRQAGVITPEQMQKILLSKGILDPRIVTEFVPQPELAPIERTPFAEEL